MMIQSELTGDSKNYRIKSLEDNKLVAWYSKGAIFKRPTVFGGMGVGRVLPTLNRAKSKKATFVAKALFNAMNMLTSR